MSDMKAPTEGDFVHLVTQTFGANAQLEWMTLGATVSKTYPDRSVDLVVRYKRPQIPDKELGTEIPFGEELWTEMGLQCKLCQEEKVHWHWPGLARFE